MGKVARPIGGDGGEHMLLMKLTGTIVMKWRKRDVY